MKLWIVKIDGNNATRPLPIAEAAAFAELAVEVQGGLCNIEIEFYAQEL